MVMFFLSTYSSYSSSVNSITTTIPIYILAFNFLYPMPAPSNLHLHLTLASGLFPESFSSNTMRMRAFWLRQAYTVYAIFCSLLFWVYWIYGRALVVHHFFPSVLLCLLVQKLFALFFFPELIVYFHHFSLMAMSQLHQ